MHPSFSYERWNIYLVLRTNVFLYYVQMESCITYKWIQSLWETWDVVLIVAYYHDTLQLGAIIMHEMRVFVFEYPRSLP